MKIIYLLRLSILISFAPLMGSSLELINPNINHAQSATLETLRAGLQRQMPRCEVTFEDAKKIQQDHLDFADAQLKAFAKLNTPPQFADYMIEQDKETELKILLSTGRGEIFADKQFKALLQMKDKVKTILQSDPSKGFLAKRDPKIPIEVIKIFEDALRTVGINPQNINIETNEFITMASANTEGSPCYEYESCGEVTYPILTEINNISFYLSISPLYANSFRSDPQRAKATALHEVLHFMLGHVVAGYVLSSNLLNGPQMAATKRQREFTADVFSATLGLDEAQLIHADLERYTFAGMINNGIHTEPRILLEAVSCILKAHQNNGIPKIEGSGGETQSSFTKLGVGGCVIAAMTGVWALLELVPSYRSKNSTTKTSSPVNQSEVTVDGVQNLEKSLGQSGSLAEDVSTIVEEAKTEDIVTNLDKALEQAKKNLTETTVGDSRQNKKVQVSAQEKLSLGPISNETLSTVKKTALISVLAAGALKLCHYCYSNNGANKAQIWVKKALYYAQKYKKMTMAAVGSLMVVGFYSLQNR